MIKSINWGLVLTFIIVAIVVNVAFSMFSYQVQENGVIKTKFGMPKKSA